MEVITATITITTTFLRVTSVDPSAIDNLARLPNGLWVVISIVARGFLAMGFYALTQKGDAKAREATP